MRRRPPRPIRTAQLFPYTTLFRSLRAQLFGPDDGGSLARAGRRPLYLALSAGALRLSETSRAGNDAIEPACGSRRRRCYKPVLLPTLGAPQSLQGQVPPCSAAVASWVPGTIRQR